MLSSALLESHRSATWTKCGWTLWMFVFSRLSGVLSLVTVHQPPALAAALNDDVIMPCKLHLSEGDNFVTTPVLYWSTGNVKLWQPSEAYRGRVRLQNSSDDSLDKSLILEKVQWADSRVHTCKVSIRSEQEGSTRKLGNHTTLMVYDAVVLNLTGHNDSLLRCEVNVSPQSTFALSIIHDGCSLHTSSSAANGSSDLPYVSLSLTVSLQGAGEYRCQLQLGGDPIAESRFSFNLTEPKEAGNAADDTNMCSLEVPENKVVVVYPEPWPLYMALLLVSAIALLSVVTATLMRSRCLESLEKMTKKTSLL